MPLSEDDRKYILKEFLKSISYLTDKEYQLRVWIRGEGPEVDSFDETICQFFEVCDPVLEEYKDFGITESQYQVLKKFRDQFRKFSYENNWPPEFIETPEWEKIMDMAREVLKTFNYTKNDK